MCQFPFKSDSDISASELPSVDMDPRAPLTICGLSMTEIFSGAHTLLLDDEEFAAAEYVRQLFSQVDRVEYLVVSELSEPFFQFPKGRALSA